MERLHGHTVWTLLRRGNALKYASLLLESELESTVPKGELVWFPFDPVLVARS
jgi:hypothetical protein